MFFMFPMEAWPLNKCQAEDSLVDAGGSDGFAELEFRAEVGGGAYENDGSKFRNIIHSTPV